MVAWARDAVRRRGPRCHRWSGSPSREHGRRRLQHGRGERTGCSLAGRGPGSPTSVFERPVLPDIVQIGGRVDATRVPGPRRVRPLRVAGSLLAGRKQPGSTRGAVSPIRERGRPAGVPVPRVPDRRDYGWFCWLLARRFGNPDAPIHVLHPRIVLQQAEKGIALRVDEDAVVFVACPVKKLENRRQSTRPSSP